MAIPSGLMSFKAVDLYINTSTIDRGPSELGKRRFSIININNSQVTVESICAYIEPTAARYSIFFDSSSIAGINNKDLSKAEKFSKIDELRDGIERYYREAPLVIDGKEHTTHPSLALANYFTSVN